MDDSAVDDASTVGMLWSRDDPAPARRALSRRRIVEAAVRIADEKGLESLSMPQLARSLDSAPMSLYRHVPGKDALIDLMLDHAVGPPPAEVDTAGSWRARLAGWARANREVFRRHPWTLPLVTGPRPMGPNECAWGEAAIRVLVEAGAPPALATRMLMLINAYVLGASVTIADRAPSAATLRASGHATGLPLMTAVLAGDAADDPGTDPFEFGLARVLDGVAQYLDE